MSNSSPDRAIRALRMASLLLLSACLAAPALGSGRIDLNPDWQFRVDPQGSGETSGWARQAPANTESVRIPHTWNVGTWHDYLGVAWYFKRFPMPAKLPNGHVELHFGATFYSSRVWLNGVEIGQHEGGFTEYSFDVTRQLKDTNLLVVELDNRPGAATIPGFGGREKPTSWYDWWDYGGIVRDVWLATTGPVWVRRQHIRTAEARGGAVVEEKVFLESALKSAAPVTVRATAYGPDGQAAGAAKRVVPAHSGAVEADLELTLSSPKLWSIDEPNLYRMVVDVTDASGRTLDEHTDTFGVRTIRIQDRHLLINGERVRLTGIARHEDSPWEGLAETVGTMRHDYDDIKVLQTTLTRPVHYPQNPYILDYADRHGIVLIPEVPVWQFSEKQLADPKVLALAERQMQEMIEQAGNHPSIFAWSAMNESAAGTPAGIAYFRAMRDFIHRIDPGRYVSFADDNLAKLDRADQSAANDADFIMMNQYFGSWHGPASALVPALDKIDRLFPEKMVIISEMGYAGIFAKDPVSADLARIVTMQEQMPELARRDWIAGAILWCYQDYKSRRNLWPGQTEGFVEHGLVDENRQRKPSYAVWQQLTAPAKLEAAWIRHGADAPTGFSLTVTPNGVRDLPSYALRDYRLTWALLDEKGKAVTSGEKSLASFTDPVSVTGDVSAEAATHALRLLVTLLRPLGTAAATRELAWSPGHGGTPAR